MRTIGQHTTLLWFRRDLRLRDHAALSAAAKRGTVVPIFIYSREDEGEGASLGGASRWWLHQSLTRLEESLRRLGSRLIYRSGPILPTLEGLCDEVDADGLVWHRSYESGVAVPDDEIETQFRGRLPYLKGFPGYLLVEPAKRLNQSGQPYRVFTPYWKRCIQDLAPSKPLPRPRELCSPKKWPLSEPLSEWGLLPKAPWGKGIEHQFTPGEEAAQMAANRFFKKRVLNYGVERNRPDLDGTSGLSPYLHFGEISPRQVWDSLRRFANRERIAAPVWKGWQFVTELGWREFAAHLLYHFPHTVTEPLRPEFDRYPWNRKQEHFTAWQKGQTGYPIVDAGMRQLWTTGWMHNRVRMIVASFLIKHLRIRWQDGAAWFWDTLVDADLASNTLGWQWTAGCSADAAPYFRVFNPIFQGEKFDPEGDYVRHWVPELKRLPNKYLNRPWEAPEAILRQAGVTLGINYPNPVVDHAAARQRALDGYAAMRADREEVGDVVGA